MKKIPIIGEQLFLIDDFLTQEECMDLILRSEQHGYEEAKVQIDGQQLLMKTIRNNTRILWKDEQLQAFIWERFQPFAVQETELCTVSGLNELFRFYKYESGQRFKKHRDGSFIRNDREFSCFTLLIYLNDNFTGGETTFDQHTIKPAAGRAVVFLHELKHAGEPVTAGSKYVLRTDVMYQMP